MRQAPTNTHRTAQGTTSRTSPTYEDVEIEIISPRIPPVYIVTHYGGNLPSPMGTVATTIIKIAPETQCKNAIDIFNFLNIQGSNLRGLNREDTLFTALILAPVTQQVKLVCVMGLGTASICQTSSIANKLCTRYGDVGPAISPSQTLVLEVIIRYKVLVKNLTP